MANQLLCKSLQPSALAKELVLSLVSEVVQESNRTDEDSFVFPSTIASAFDTRVVVPTGLGYTQYHLTLRSHWPIGLAWTSGWIGHAKSRDSTKNGAPSKFPKIFLLDSTDLSSKPVRFLRLRLAKSCPPGVMGEFKGFRADYFNICKNGALLDAHKYLYSSKFFSIAWRPQFSQTHLITKSPPLLLMETEHAVSIHWCHFFLEGF